MATLTLWLQGKFYCLLMHSANSLDPDVAQQNDGHNLDPNLLIFIWYSRRTTFIKSNVENYCHLKMLPALNICCINSSAFQPFFIEANNMNPDQPALKEII